MKRSNIVGFLTTFLAYFVTAKMGLSLHPVSGFATLIWPPSGIALAALLLGGLQLWPAIFLAASLINIVTGAPYYVACGIGIGNTLEAVVGAYLLIRFTDFHKSLDRMKDVISLTFLGCILSTLVSATVGVASLWLGDIKSFEGIGNTWRAWWAGDGVGELIVTPLILVWATSDPWKKKFDLWRKGELVLLAMTLVSGELFVLGRESADLFWLFPPVVWGALRFGQRGNVIVTFTISILAVWVTAQGRGPFARASAVDDLFHLLSFMIVIATTGLALATILLERERSKLRTKRLESDLHYEGRFRLMVEMVKDYAIFMFDVRGFITTWNEGAKRITGYEASDIIGKHFSIFYPAEDSEKPSKELIDAERNNRCEDEGWRVKKDGTKYWSHVVITAVRGTRGELLGFCKVCRDLTEKRNNEERLRLAYDNLERRIEERTKELKSALQVRDNFLSIASHELRTPLTSLYMQLQIIERMFRKSKKGTLDINRLGQKIASSEERAKQLGGLIDILLDVSRAGNQAMSLECEKVSLISLTKNVVEKFKDEARKAGSQLIFMTPENDTKMIGNFDRLRMSQAITNLVTNAIKYGNRKPIEISLSTNGKTAQIVVKDYGLGVATQDQKRIFERFERAVSHHNISGMGLGLYITREIVNAHGGKILLESEVQKGSTFILELPITEDPPLATTVVSDKVKLEGHFS